MDPTLPKNVDNLASSDGETGEVNTSSTTTTPTGKDLDDSKEESVLTSPLSATSDPSSSEKSIPTKEVMNREAKITNKISLPEGIEPLDTREHTWSVSDEEKKDVKVDGEWTSVQRKRRVSKEGTKVAYSNYVTINRISMRCSAYNKERKECLNKELRWLTVTMLL